MKFVFLALFVALACVSAIPAGDQDTSGTGAKCEYPETLEKATQDFIDATNGEYSSFVSIFSLIIFIHLFFFLKRPRLQENSGDAPWTR